MRVAEAVGALGSRLADAATLPRPIRLAWGVRWWMVFPISGP